MASKVNDRKRRAHTKSRSGCDNCKLRRVKCDEKRPACKKCSEFGIACSYGRTPNNDTADLQPLIPVSGSYHVQTLIPNSPSFNTTVLNVINGSLSETCEAGEPVLRLGDRDLETWKRFCCRTVTTIGAVGTSRAYQEATPRLSCSNPFLMHISLVVTLLHDRYLASSPVSDIDIRSSPLPPPSTTELYHCYRGTALFNAKLTQLLSSPEKDALWIASVLLGVATIASIDASCPEQSWPLKPSSASDLDWLRMSDGKREVWRLADFSREDSALHALHNEIDGSRLSESAPSTSAAEMILSNIPAPLLGLLQTEVRLDDERSPYYRAAIILGQLMSMDCNTSTMLMFFSFLGQMEAAFSGLLRDKDPIALLILTYWYAKICDVGCWYYSRRSVLECRSLCLYLQRYHSGISHLENILEYPRRSCGLPSHRVVS